MSEVRAADIVERVVAAHERRLAAGLGGDTTAYRLVHDHWDALPALRIERLAHYALVKYRHDVWAEDAAAGAVVEGLRRCGLRGAAFVLDAAEKDRTPAHEARDAALDAWLQDIGFRAPRETILARECGRTYALSAREGYSAGLFFDMRACRDDLAQRWTGRRVLNLFAYTCGFGVALGRDNEVTNVDTSRRLLDWGQHNYTLNGLPADDAHFVRKDAFSYLEVAARVGNTFDGVILDPPSYSTGKKGFARRFSLKTDFQELLGLALDALSSGGELFVSTNWEGTDAAAFEATIRRLAGPRGRRIVHSWPPGPDFPVPAEDFHLKTALLT